MNNLLLWYKMVLAQVNGALHDLTTRQYAILLTIYLEDAPHTVRGLANRLNIAKPAITRALDCLAAKQLIKRTVDIKNKRSIFIERTMKGAIFLMDVSDMVQTLNKEIQS